MNTAELSLSPAEQRPYASSQRLRSASTQHRIQFGDERVYTGSIDDYGASAEWAPQPSGGSGPGSGGGTNAQHYQAQRSVSSSSSGGNLHAGLGQHEEVFLDLSASFNSAYPSISSDYPSSSSSYAHDGLGLSEMDVDATMAPMGAYQFDPSLSDHEQQSDHASHSHAHEYDQRQESYHRHENPPRHQQFQQQYQPHHSFTPSTGVHSAPDLASSDHYYGQPAPPSTAVSTNEASEDDAPLSSPYLGSPPSSPTKGSRARTRFQNRVSKAQPYPTSSSASPARSRSGSIKSSMLPSLSISTSHQSGSASSSPSFFPGGLPSPYRQSSTPNSATMDPSQSIRSSSPSSASSVSGNAMSRASSFSAASSIPPHEAALSEALAASTASIASMASAVSSANLYRSSASSTTATPVTVSRSQSRRGSPTKNSTGRVRKLCDIDRREVCLYSAANPGMKQDLIASKFDIDRTTVSKILRDKTKWLAIVGPRPDTAVAESPDSAATRSAGDNPSSPPSVATPHQLPTFPHTPHQGAVTSSTPMSMTSSISGLFSELSTTGTPSISHNRSSSDSTGISKIDSEVLNWVQSSMRIGAEPSDEALKTKAKEVAKRHRGLEMFKATGAWLDNFKTRTGLGRLLTARNTIVEESNLSDVSEDNLESHDDDDEHAEGRDRTQRGKTKRSKRQSILRRVHNEGAAASSSPLKSSETFGSSGGATSLPNTLKASKMEVDSRTPLRQAFAGSMSGDTSLDSEATPTHSTVHSRATSGTASASTDQEFNEAFAQYGTESTGSSIDQRRASPYGKGPTLSTPSRSGSFGSNKSLSTNGYSPSDPSQSPFAFGGFPPDGNNANAFGNPFPHSNSGGSGSNGTDYPLKSPFQTSSRQSSSQSLYSASFNAASGLPGSTDNSPQATYNPHGRSFSIASSTSSFSGLTAFSSQTSQGTPLSTSMSHSQSSSVPSTPAMGTSGYYSHGPTGTLSQLQAAFGTGQAPQAPVQISPQTVAPYLIQGGASEQSPQRIGLARRQTISGFPSPRSFQSVDLAPPSRVQSQAVSQQTSRRPSTASISDFAAIATTAPGSGSSTPVTALQAFEGLMMAHRWLNSQDASGFTQPGDLIASSDLRSRLAERLGLDLPSEAPGPLPRSASMSASMSLPGSRGATPSLSSSTTSNASAIHTGGKVQFPNSPSRPTRMRSGRTQSTSSIPQFSRSHSTLSLLDASMAEESQQHSHVSLHQ
ncbi:BZ3500_MvSof-1268-A1-R1_Chr3-3g06424 [Microbotryum saponariae]|uniref:BZ3500_MvSof-1268-A1-R1_Chr3-3g06424 protein n=1 Tax=Microbotryum saponariae TaxID=289078 RepID=A0A2X0LC03_9BASI|nr:BZ3500_MvSof-1268-A1-R1_Chr3-3g06424 [Microbotryum saponariae]SDA04391.1 BZ3501_MvSof-1269-A2-R1_Chr3-2g06111 [Microbotryum saponariae]